jgi:hypothetical protein
MQNGQKLLEYGAAQYDHQDNNNLPNGLKLTAQRNYRNEDQNSRSSNQQHHNF